MLQKWISPEVQFIILDLDDTLIGSEIIYKKIYSDLKLDSDIFNKARSCVKSELNLNNCLVSSHNRLLYFKYYLELQNQFSADALLKLNDQYETRLQVEIKADLQKNHHIEVLTQLAAKFPLGILTNENLRTQLLKIKMLDPHGKLFQFLFTSEESGVEKPHPFIIHKAIKRTGLEPQQVLMVGDSVKNDLRPFSQLGCSVIGSRQFRNESTAQDGFRWIESLSELLEKSESTEKSEQIKK